jgi:hypothetical protein
MKLYGSYTGKSIGCCFVLLLIIVALTIASASYCSAAASKDKQKTFESPEAAVKAMINAIKTDNKKALSAIFLPASELSSGDEVSDRAERQKFLKAYEEKNSLEKKDDDIVILQVGNDDWQFPIPIVKKGLRWYFNTKAGQEELLNRRIGRNELYVIETMHAYVDVQREYATKNFGSEGGSLYAQKFMSTPGKKDGLYWEAKEGEEKSPAGPFFAKAAQEGYFKKSNSGKPSSFHGYYFRILTAQGKNAPGGPYSYVVNGKMIFGFGLIAYPAKYGASGVMTFMVNQNGIVYEKDLGGNTEQIASTMTKYDPDTTWVRGHNN